MQEFTTKLPEGMPVFGIFRSISAGGRANVRCLPLVWGGSVRYDKNHLNRVSFSAIMIVLDVIGNVIDNGRQKPCLLWTRSQ